MNDENGSPEASRSPCSSSPTCAGFMGLKLETDKILRKKIPGSSIIYVPSGKFLKYATFGYSGLAADMIYLWAIQYYSTYEIADRFTYLDHIFAIIAELDPRYTDPYEVGSMIAAKEARDIPWPSGSWTGGSPRTPTCGSFPLRPGTSPRRSSRTTTWPGNTIGKAMVLPGAPDFTKRLYANAAFKVTDFKTSWETWLEVYNTATDDRVKKIASNHLYQVKAEHGHRRPERGRREVQGEV